MPLYEYLCLECRRISEHLVFREEDFTPYCRRCGSQKVRKLISRVRVRLSLDSRLERLADPALLSGLDEEDPRRVRRFMEKMGAEFGEELGDDFEEVLGEAEEEMEKELSREGGSEEGDGGEGETD
ncbi:zinc ribbon domain-containing protein [Thermosulfurimonas marina]|uniref:Zinc ribbon domain-containing protein n=1 Tax=Thermosulfurimonas marina TaxID=2047767 RepID=A0A6H1WSC7_9BACT|nr:zinc ribbon domain-containing protein [Thermosulfurimonas marina]QJA06125.1 zinc ribbon domain-containing protein [Thermosulfurimonas marina]